jgi:diguanylate cyclase (GGDEF)-like protein
MARSRAFARRLAGLDDARGDDALYAHLVRSVFPSPSALLAANVMGVVIAFCGWFMTDDGTFLLGLAVILIAGFARMRLILAYHSARSPSTRADHERYDLWFFLSSLILSLMIGLISAGLIAYPAALGTHALGLGAAIGYAMGFAARNAGRPNLVLAQLLACIGPPLISYAINTPPHAIAYVVMLSGLIVANVRVSRTLKENIVQHYHAMTETETLARFDALTKLPNRHAFSSRLDAAIAAHPEKPFAILFLDLDRFKEINDTLGHSFGDAVIREMGVRLAALTPDVAHVARFGGDEFLVQLDEAAPAAVGAKCVEMLDALSQPYEAEAVSTRTTVTIGVALYPDHGATREELFRKADIALYEAKKEGGGCWRRFDAAIAAEMETRRMLESDMRAAIDGGAFVAYFQPIYDLRDHRVVAFEALVRWRHPTRGLVSPGLFIPIAEKGPMIDEIGAHILREACEVAATWPAQVAVAVNISVAQFVHPEKLVAAVQDALRVSRLPAERLHLEITESLLLHDSALTRQTIQHLVEIGVKFALDDFGTGYSSLSYLKDFPFSKVKIDRTFTESLMSSAASPSIVKAVAQIAADLALDVVIEGVETREQEDLLRQLGPTQGQGFLFSRPVPAEATHDFFAKAGDVRRSA